MDCENTQMCVNLEKCMDVTTTENNKGVNVTNLHVSFYHKNISEALNTINALNICIHFLSNNIEYILITSPTNPQANHNIYLTSPYLLFV